VLTKGVSRTEALGGSSLDGALGFTEFKENPRKQPLKGGKKKKKSREPLIHVVFKSGHFMKKLSEEDVATCEN